MEEAARAHFFHHGEPGREDEKDTCHACQIRSFRQNQDHPVTLVNHEDDVKLDPEFRFVDDSYHGTGVEPSRDGFRSGCECQEGEDCQYGTCACLQEVDNNSSDDEDDEYEHAGQYRKKAYAYHSHGSKAGLLRSRILDTRQPIYECHEMCACGHDCPNRVVERGRQIPIQIFRTKNRGWGVRSTVDIKKGQFVDKYMGEIITSAEADRRRNDSHKAERKDVYLFALDKFSNEDSPDERLRGPPLEVDGEFMSGPTRFVNHSCDPNMRIFARVGDHADKHLHDLALFAIRDINRGEELTFDYVDGVEDKDAYDPEKQKDMTECLCGSEECRGFLW
ncbi:SET domain protein [Microdochium bolleyi]|uniref:SET domain protein n=1 Tax=Microdochium bolleyi TaxID=196109 RepID=A0A136J3H6_9PEZI|nr:SET domain protein [Microdochium bolleyi]